jgi:probable rRNA maturation factor
VSVYLRNATRGRRLDPRRLRRTTEQLLTALGEGGASVSLTLVRDAEIRALNRAYRGKDRATDVLSFPLGPSAADPTRERLLGDVVISVDTAARQAADYDAPLEREIERLLIHGLLHLLGHDHEQAGERERMEAEERRLAAVIDLPWPYD